MIRIEEVSTERIGEFSRYFYGPQPEMVLASVVEGNTATQLWYATQPGNNIVCLLWDKGNNVFYLSGELTEPDTEKAFTSLINNTIKERAIKEGLSYFKVKTLSSSLENSLAGIFQNIPLHCTDKFFYTYRSAQVRPVPTPRFDGIHYLPIDADLLEKSEYKNNHLVRSEVEWMWSSLVKFRENGFGIAAVVDGVIIGWCTAEYVSTNQCGIGIEVIEQYQTIGVATAIAAKFIERCLNHQITAHWECDRDNIGSVRVAEKVGFELIEESIFWSGRFLIN